MATAVRAMHTSETDAAAEFTTDKDTLFMLGGIALMVFGAGLVLANPVIRRYMGNLGIGSLASAALPDLQRYIRLRDM
jgi:hypothetical protein